VAKGEDETAKPLLECKVSVAPFEAFSSFEVLTKEECEEGFFEKLDRYRLVAISVTDKLSPPALS